MTDISDYTHYNNNVYVKQDEEVMFVSNNNIIIDGSTICDPSCLCMFPRDQIFAAVIDTNLHHSTYGHSRILIIHVMVDQAPVV